MDYPQTTITQFTELTDTPSELFAAIHRPTMKTWSYFPASAYVMCSKSVRIEIAQFLDKTQRTHSKYLPVTDSMYNGIAWNASSYWGICHTSGKQKYSIHKIFDYMDSMLYPIKSDFPVFGCTNSTERALVQKIVALFETPMYKRKFLGTTRGKDSCQIAWDDHNWWYCKVASNMPYHVNPYINNLITQINNYHDISKESNRNQVHQTPKSERKLIGKGLRVPKRTKQITSSKRLVGNKTRAVTSAAKIQRGTLQRHH